MSDHAKLLEDGPGDFERGGVREEPQSKRPDRPRSRPTTPFDEGSVLHVPRPLSPHRFHNHEILVIPLEEEDFEEQEENRETDEKTLLGRVIDHDIPLHYPHHDNHPIPVIESHYDTHTPSETLPR